MYRWKVSHFPPYLGRLSGLSGQILQSCFWPTLQVHFPTVDRYRRNPRAAARGICGQMSPQKAASFVKGLRREARRRADVLEWTFSYWVIWRVNLEFCSVVA